VGLGLVSIKERTRLVNGTFDIQSQPNHGTTLTVTVPVA
jgi:signal transduction histidine kinase